MKIQEMLIGLTLGLLCRTGGTVKADFAYVSNFNSSTVSRIDLGTNTLVTTFGIGGASTVAVAITPDGNRTYVAHRNTDDVSVFDLASNTVQQTIAVGNGPVSVAITEDSASAYVLNNQMPIITVLNLTSNTVSGTLPVTDTNPISLAINVLACTVRSSLGGANPGAIAVTSVAPGCVEVSINVKALGRSSKGACLTDDEIKRLWRYLEKKVGQPAKQRAREFLQIALLTGHRRVQVSGTRIEELELYSDKPVWRIPHARAKNKSTHLVPLNTWAAKLFAAAIDDAGSHQFVVATITLLVWFALIARYSVTKLSVFTFLTPLFGALAGVFLLDEHLDHTHLISLAAIMTGIAIVNLYGHNKTYGGLAHENARYNNRAKRSEPLADHLYRAGAVAPDRPGPQSGCPGAQDGCGCH